MNGLSLSTDTAVTAPARASTCSAATPLPFVIVFSFAFFCPQTSDVPEKSRISSQNAATSKCMTTTSMSATSEIGPILQPSLADVLISQLENVGLAPARIARSEESTLLEYRGDSRACIDVYPAGDIVVVYTKGDKDIVYELTAEDFLLIPSLIRDAGVTV